jgi:hypothetical protein
MYYTWMIFAYLTPESLLPATSVIATIAGIGMILGKSSFRFLVRCCRRSLRTSSRMADMSEPHLRLRDEETRSVLRR